MPTDWVIAGLVAIIGSLSGAVGVLAKRHFDDDARRDRELEAWKAIAVAGSGDLGKLVPAVAALATAVEAEHRVASDFRASVVRTIDEIRGDIRELLGRRARRS